MSKRDDRIARLLDTPLLARAVPHLAPETLHRLIRSVGLDASDELVAAATPEQLTAVFDLDLWLGTRPGHDERFDDGRFGEWLELLADAGEEVATRTLAAIDENLVIAGLSRYIRVLDPATFEPAMSSDDVPLDSAALTFDGLECEIGGYLVRARRTDAWDAVMALLIELDTHQPDCFHAVMRGCRRLSNSAPEVDGLDDLMTAPAQTFHDLALARERRRSRQGYATPADARAFLQMARQRPADTASTNPLAASYFRAMHEAASSTGTHSPLPDTEPTAVVVDLLTEAALVPERPRALLEGTTAPLSRLARLRTLMTHLHDTNPVVYLKRSQELAFLTNTLVAGCSVQSRPLTVQEASDAAVGICNLGLEHWPATTPDALPAGHDLVSAFEIGWAVLHQSVSMFVAERLILTLTHLRPADTEIERDLYILRRELVRHRDAGTPWRVRDALSALATLDVAAWIGLLGLLDECPILPAAVTALLDGRTEAISATAFEFISTESQLQDVRAFMDKLEDVLRGR